MAQRQPRGCEAVKRCAAFAGSLARLLVQDSLQRGSRLTFATQATGELGERAPMRQEIYTTMRGATFCGDTLWWLPERHTL